MTGPQLADRIAWLIELATTIAAAAAIINSQCFLDITGTFLSNKLVIVKLA